MALDNQIGFGGIFASGPGAECANCDELRAEDVRIADVVPLTTTLVNYLETNDWPNGPPTPTRTLKSLRPQHVVPFLKEKLKCRITTVSSSSYYSNAHFLHA